MLIVKKYRSLKILRKGGERMIGSTVQHKMKQATRDRQTTNDGMLF